MTSIEKDKIEYNPTNNQINHNKKNSDKLLIQILSSNNKGNDTYKFNTIIFTNNKRKSNTKTLKIKPKNLQNKPNTLSRNNIIDLKYKTDTIPISLSLKPKVLANHKTKLILNKPPVIKQLIKPDKSNELRRDLLSRNSLLTTRSTSLAANDRNLKTLLNMYSRTGMFIDIKKNNK